MNLLLRFIIYFFGAWMSVFLPPNSSRNKKTKISAKKNTKQNRKNNSKECKKKTNTNQPKQKQQHKQKQRAERHYQSTSAIAPLTSSPSERKNVWKPSLTAAATAGAAAAATLYNWTVNGKYLGRETRPSGQRYYDYLHTVHNTSTAAVLVHEV